MTAATSTAKKSFFGTHFRNKIIEGKKLLIVNIVLHLAGLPLIAGILLRLAYLNEHEIYSYDNSESLMIVAVIALAIALLSGIIIALGNFRYLYTKSLVDMTYSLPVTTKQRFFADYFSGLTVYMVPAIIGALLSIIILGIGSAFIDLGTFWDVFPELLFAGFIVLVGMVMLYTLTVLATVCCGSTFEAPFSVIAVNIIIPATVFAGFYMIQDASFYALSDISLFSNIILTATNPFGVVVAFTNYFDNCFYNDFSFAVRTFVRWLIPTLIVIAAYFGLSYLLYSRRKAEQVSKPYVYKIFYYIIMLLAVFCMMSIFLINSEAMAAGIIICAILFFIVEVITKRGFTRFWESILRFGISLAAVFSFFFVCQNTEGFGCSEYVPREAAVSSVSFDSYDMITFSTVYKDEAVIKETVQLHESIIARKDAVEKGADNIISAGSLSVFENDPEVYSLNNYGNYLTITYYLKNGSTVIREYDVPSDLIGGLSTAIALSDSYAENLSSEMALSGFNHAASMVFYSSLKDVKPGTDASVTLTDKLSLDEHSRRVSYEQMMALKDAYKTDLLAMTEEEYKTANVYGYFFNNHQYAIRSTFVNTIELLNELDFEDVTIDREYIEEEIASSRVRMNISTDVKPYYTIEYNKHWLQDKFTATNYSYSYAFCEYAAMITDEEPDDCLVKILERANPIVIDSTAAGAILIETDKSSAVLYLPDTDENKALLEEARNMYIEGKLQNSEDFYYDETESSTGGYYYEGEYYID